MKLKRWSTGLRVAGTMAGIAGASAQISFDNSFGTPGPLPGNTVMADRGNTVGANLFHSFSQFNVAPNQTITFQVPAATSNVLARVTGESVSRINGTISTSAPANLYLINPNGVILGQGARVNVAGSFTGTTADYLSFKDAAGTEVGRFWASGDGNVSLLSSAPSAFGFLEQAHADSGRIELGAGSIRGTSQTDLSFVGRELAASGASVAARNLTLVAAGNQAQELDLTDPVPLRASEGGVVSMDATILDSGGGGEIVIRGAGNISLTSTFAASSAAIKIRGAQGVTLSQSFLIGQPGDISVEAAEVVRLDGSFLQTFGDKAITVRSGGDLFVTSGSIKTSGDLTVAAGGDLGIDGATIATEAEADAPGGRALIGATGDLRISNRGNIFTSTSGAGRGGNLIVQAGGNLIIEGSALTIPALIRTETKGAGDGGNIELAVAGELLITGGGAVSSVSEGGGNGGKVTVQAGSLGIRGGESRLATGILTDAQGAGAGGDIEVAIAGGIRIEDVGQITASTASTGKSGSIRVAGGSLRIVGTDESLHPPDDDPRPNRIATGINLKSSQASSGELGSLDIDIREDIVLERGGLIDATVFSFNNAANAGAVTVSAGSIHADRMGSSYFTGIGSGTEANLPSAGGRGGDIQVTAETIRLFNGAQIAASTRSAGDAGSITVNARELTAAGSGRLTDFVFSRASGVVAASELESTGDAGSVTIGALGGAGGAAPFLGLSNGAEIAARSEGTGAGGEVIVDWKNGIIRISDGGAISAEAGVRSGDAGIVELSARFIDLSGGGRISSSSRGPGKEAGGVTLHPAFGMRARGGTIAVFSEGGDAGDITIHGGQLLDFRRGELIAEAFKSGGNITIMNGGSLVLSDGRVSANAQEENGGNIDFGVSRYLPGNTIPTASSRLGTDGLVRIDAVEVLGENTGELNVDPLDVTDSLQPECTQRLPTEAGSFIRAGRGGTRRLPGGYIPSLRLVKTVE